MIAREAAEAVYKLALRCEPIPEALARSAEDFVDEHRIADPFNRLLTLDGRRAPWVAHEGRQLGAVLAELDVAS